MGIGVDDYVICFDGHRFFPPCRRAASSLVVDRGKSLYGALPFLFCFTLSRIFIVFQTEIGQSAVIVGKRDRVFGKFGVLELPPHIELFLHARQALFLACEPARPGPTVRRRPAAAGPQDPHQEQ
jgi:hypothetical protein